MAGNRQSSNPLPQSKNVDQREMGCVNMRNRSMFHRPTPTHKAYEPTGVPLYLRNSVMVKQPPHQKDAPTRCLHMKNMTVKHPPPYLNNRIRICYQTYKTYYLINII